MADGAAMNINELQQMWQCDKGEEKWEAVPFVEQYCTQRPCIVRFNALYTPLAAIIYI